LRAHPRPPNTCTAKLIQRMRVLQSSEPGMRITEKVRGKRQKDFKLVLFSGHDQTLIAGTEYFYSYARTFC